MKRTAEFERLHAYRQHTSNWKHWGPYLSERAWGTVREDYSATGSAWSYFPHEHARSRVYRWNEDGLAGICDRNQYLCFSVALWNHQDSILKERLFGLTGEQGNHGEDVKEMYYYLDSTPTHSYMRMLYKYPHAAYPYDDLIHENARRGKHEFEYELLDAGVFNDNRYFDVHIEYAKAAQDDMLIKLTLTNHGPDTAPYTLLPQLWFRNTWSWGYKNGAMQDISTKPHLQQHTNSSVLVSHEVLGEYVLFAEGEPVLLFTENETNTERLFGVPNVTPFVKDAFHQFVVNGEVGAVNPERVGTKAGVLFQGELAAGASREFRLRLMQGVPDAPFAEFDAVFAQRKAEADAFYEALQPAHLSDDERLVQRQAFAGMLWSKQLYYYDVPQWLKGDPAQPPPPDERWQGRNKDWTHIANFDIISMPDAWEYPWYASWDLAFHCIPLVLVDPDFAKRQLALFTREWYMHPNGQLPAYEWAFSDVNPPVHAWACMRVYQIDAKQTGVPDRDFLESVFHKLLINFTWWVNRKDAKGRNIFEGGFLGLDNISVFDRSAPLPTGGFLSQSDGTAWMGFYCLSMLTIALELAKENAVYEDVAAKFFEHFLRIAHAMNDIGQLGHGLWDDEDGLFYDALNLPDGQVIPLKVRSLVGLMPLIAVSTLEADIYERMPRFARRMEWFLHHRPEVAGDIADLHEHGCEKRMLLSFLSREKLERLLAHVLDEDGFLSEHGVRSVSKFHEAHPYVFHVNGDEAFSVAYEPAESRSGLFGGNSNWRGPVWFPINYLLIEALQRYDYFYDGEFKVAFPTGSDTKLTLWEVAAELSRRLTGLFLRDEDGKRPVFGAQTRLQTDPAWRDYLLFYEYFHGDNGAGLGASHQTGWTGLVAKLLQQSGGQPALKTHRHKQPEQEDV